MATIYCESSPSDVHEEDREIVEKLSKLQSMHDQLLQLRTLLPERLVSPIKQVTSTSMGSGQVVLPSTLAATVRKVAVEGNQEVQNFKKEWYSEEMRALWEKTNGADFPQGDDCWRVNYKSLMSETKMQVEITKAPVIEAEKPDLEAKEDPKEVVKTARDQFRTIKIEVMDEATGLPLAVKVAGMTFMVTTEQNAGETDYIVATKPGLKSSALSQEILRCLESRKNKHSLTYLLNMLASYVDVRTRACDTCGQVFDEQLQLAIVKVSKAPMPENKGKPMEWLAYHHTCI